MSRRESRESVTKKTKSFDGVRDVRFLVVSSEDGHKILFSVADFFKILYNNDSFVFENDSNCRSVVNSIILEAPFKFDIRRVRWGNSSSLNEVFVDYKLFLILSSVFSNIDESLTTLISTLCIWMYKVEKSFTANRSDGGIRPRSESIYSGGFDNDNDGEVGSGFFAVTQIADFNGLSPNELNEILSELGVQRKVNGQWVIREKLRHKGYTKPMMMVKNGKAILHTYWTHKGFLYINSLLKSYKADQEQGSLF